MTSLHVPPGGWTVDDLPDREDGRYELVDGALLVSPSPTPRHCGVAARAASAVERRRSWMGRARGVVDVLEPLVVTVDVDALYS